MTSGAEEVPAGRVPRWVFIINSSTFAHAPTIYSRIKKRLTKLYFNAYRLGYYEIIYDPFLI